MSIFNSVLVRKPGRSLFNLKHERKFSCDWANLYPILCMEAVPGDTFKISTEFFVRTSPLVAPIMHRVNVKINYFFVPNRLLWSEWKDFITGINQLGTYDPTSQDQSNYFVSKIPPFFELTSGYAYPEHFRDGSLADFLGFPTMRPTESISGTINVQLLPFNAYQKIYNDWYRNQNVEAEHGIIMTSGKTTNPGSIFNLRKRMWEKDYFTSALPFAQRGNAVEIPTAGVTFDAKGKPTVMRDASDNSRLPANFQNGVTTKVFYDTNTTGANDYMNATNQSSSVDLAIDNSAQLKVNMGTINDLRIATKLQRWLEVNARVGGRYIEQILGHFGVHSSDARLDRSEYLGGFTSPLVVSEVEQNSATVSGSTPQANLAGKASSYGNSKPVKCFCEEHGFIIGIMSILPRTTYQDGLPKMFDRNYKEDYYFPEFANLGEQDVKKSEVYFNLADSTKRSFDRFGFQERFCEYKYVPSTVHGEFKNNLQFWHLGRSFSDIPALNSTFVTCSPRTNVFAVESGADHFYVNLINNVTAMRPMPKQAIPSL